MTSLFADHHLIFHSPILCGLNTVFYLFLLLMLTDKHIIFV